MIRIARRGCSQHRIFTDDRALTEVDPGAFGIKDGSVHDAGTWTHPNRADQDGRRRNECGWIHHGLTATMSYQHGRPLCSHIWLARCQGTAARTMCCGDHAWRDAIAADRRLAAVVLS